jgi:hypothetical protein
MRVVRFGEHGLSCAPYRSRRPNALDLVARCTIATAATRLRRLEFLDLSRRAKERDLELALLNDIQSFLMEMGCGFALIGRQFPLKIIDEETGEEQEFFIDLLSRTCPRWPTSCQTSLRQPMTSTTTRCQPRPNSHDEPAARYSQPTTALLLDVRAPTHRPAPTYCPMTPNSWA